jgi:hypothetical protein
MLKILLLHVVAWVVIGIGMSIFFLHVYGHGELGTFGWAAGLLIVAFGAWTWTRGIAARRQRRERLA